MSRRDIHNKIKVERAISPHQVSDNTAAVGEIHDMQGFESIEFLIAYGTLADAGAEFTPQLDEGDAANLSDAAAVDDADLLGTETQVDQTADDTVQKLGYRGNKRYVRLTITPTNNASAADLSAVAIKGTAQTEPTS